MADQLFETLLERMPNIAKVVNAFTSEDVQTQAFGTLISALLRGENTPQGFKATDGPHIDSAKAKSGRRARTGRLSGRTASEIVHELNLKPEGKMSFADFVAKKKPSSNEDKYAVAVYYLEQILQLPKISDGHVATVFRLTADWREPDDTYGGLKKTAARKVTIDMSDRNNIKTTPQGRNFVEHDLPPKSKSK